MEFKGIIHDKTFSKIINKMGYLSDYRLFNCELIMLYI